METLIARPETIRQAIHRTITELRQSTSIKNDVVRASGDGQYPATVEQYDDNCRQRIKTLEALLWRV